MRNALNRTISRKKQGVPLRFKCGERLELLRRLRIRIAIPIHAQISMLIVAIFNTYQLAKKGQKQAER
jgi:hypothetical protein